MIDSPPRIGEAGRVDATGRHDAPKFRKCLKCRESFESEWAGQRVCGKCKKKTHWRSGAMRQAF
jgi:hypothetical protein